MSLPDLAAGQALVVLWRRDHHGHQQAVSAIVYRNRVCLHALVLGPPLRDLRITPGELRYMQRARLPDGRPYPLRRALRHYAEAARLAGGISKPLRSVLAQLRDAYRTPASAAQQVAA